MKKIRVIQIPRYIYYEGTWYEYVDTKDSGKKFETFINLYSHYEEVTNNEKIKELEKEVEY